MIDTDKYEGHTPGPWWLSECGDYIDAQNWIECEDTGDGWIQGIARMTKEDGECDLVFSNVDKWKANAQLIADAPLLLAKLERLLDAALDARIVLMKHYKWMSMNDSTTVEEDEEILTVVRALKEASE